MTVLFLLSYPERSPPQTGQVCDSLLFIKNIFIWIEYYLVSCYNNHVFMEHRNTRNQLLRRVLYNGAFSIHLLTYQISYLISLYNSQ